MATSLVASRPCAYRLRSVIAHFTGPQPHRLRFRVAYNVDPTLTSSSGTSNESGRGKHVDTRIHWGNSTEGWIGIEASDWDPAQSRAWGRSARNNAGILDQAPDSHYRYMGVSPDAEMEEIKSAYRRLSKQYHPDTTSLPLEIAAQKFMRLKDAYDTLSNDDQRNVYDSRLESKITSSNAGGLTCMDTQVAHSKATMRHPRRNRSAWTLIHLGVAIRLSVANPCQLWRLICFFYSSAFV